MQVLVIEEFLIEIRGEGSVGDAVTATGLSPRGQVLLIGLLRGTRHVELGAEGGGIGNIS